jgi:hypothetical protein
LEGLQQRAINLEAAQLVIQDVARRTQEQLEYKLSELTTLALASVFENPYKLRVCFENKRGRTEASILFEDADGNLIEPMDASGVGPVDVASMALRLTLLCSSIPRLRPTVLLDEPFRCVSKDNIPRAMQMIRDIATRLHVQFIIISHNDEIVECADMAWEVTKRGNTSVVTPLNNHGKPLETPVEGEIPADPLPVPPPDTKPSVKRRSLRKDA